MSQEEILFPDLPIIDAHHHLIDLPGYHYELDELIADAASGHRIAATIHMECRRDYRSGGSPALAPVGETESIERLIQSRFPAGSPLCAGIVGHADLTLGDAVEPVLIAHRAASPKRFCGIRHMVAWDSSDVHITVANPHPDLLRDPAFAAGARMLAKHDLPLDTWAYHTQLADLATFAATVPELDIVVDHLGTPLGTGPYAGRHDAVFVIWKQGLKALAAHGNVFMKLGGFPQHQSGLGWPPAPAPMESEALAAGMRDYYRFAIDLFGPARCLFESNYPVDRESWSFTTLWNAFKRIAAAYSPEERLAMFHDTAVRLYRCDRRASASAEPGRL